MSCSAKLSCVENNCALDPNGNIFQCVQQNCSQGGPGGGMALFQVLQCGQNSCATECPGL
jgi:hypothetical protein